MTSSSPRRRRERHPTRSGRSSGRFADSYGLVLLLLVVSYFCTAILSDYAWGQVVDVLVLAAAAWLALRASQAQRRGMRIAQALIPLATRRRSTAATSASSP